MSALTVKTTFYAKKIAFFYDTYNDLISFSAHKT